MRFKIGSWNVNSVKVRFNLIKKFLSDTDCDVLLLQEVKCLEKDFPEFDNYHSVVLGQKSYNGVAILSKHKFENFTKEFSFNNNEARYIQASIKKDGTIFNIGSVYVPNGTGLFHDNYDKKLKFMQDFTKYSEDFLVQSGNQNLVIGGDFNICPSNLDVYDYIAMKDKLCFTQEEKILMRRFMNRSFIDCHRFLHPKSRDFTWFDYRGREDKLRLDFIFANFELIDSLKKSYLKNEFKFMDRPSDHIPIICEFYKT